MAAFSAAPCAVLVASLHPVATCCEASSKRRALLPFCCEDTPALKLPLMMASRLAAAAALTPTLLDSSEDM
jgi:hypothetical protein